MVPTASRRWHERMADRLPAETGFICRQSLARALQGWWQHGSLRGRDISPQCSSRGAGLAVCGCTQTMWKRRACQVKTLMLIACWSCHHQRASILACLWQPLGLHRCHGRAQHARHAADCALQHCWARGRTLQAGKAPCALLVRHMYEHKILQLAVVRVFALACAKEEEQGQRCTAACTGMGTKLPRVPFLLAFFL